MTSPASMNSTSRRAWKSKYETANTYSVIALFQSGGPEDMKIAKTLAGCILPGK
jgi:hypothetical protein